MSCSAIFILDLKGNVIMSRNYRGDVDMTAIEKFMPLLLEQEDEAKHHPLCRKTNANAALIFSWLYKCVEVFTCYFKDLEEESVRDNFVVIYELLDEIIHHSRNSPTRNCSSSTHGSHQCCVLAVRRNQVSQKRSVLDVIESVNLLANASGTVLRSEIVGSIRMRVILSGMPELRLGLNDKVLFQSWISTGVPVENGESTEFTTKFSGQEVESTIRHWNATGLPVETMSFNEVSGNLVEPLNYHWNALDIQWIFCFLLKKLK
uniref:MHD domain-containing protein n=1 Tax=Ditylenchus dipsaci TaxID=166011 RepID=A0A915E7W7_9BILA